MHGKHAELKTNFVRSMSLQNVVSWNLPQLMLAQVLPFYVEEKFRRGPGKLHCIGESVAEVFFVKEHQDWWSEQQSCHSNCTSVA